MRFDYSKLRGKIYEKFGNIKNFCEEIKTSPATLRAKLNNKTSFNNIDIVIICEKLDIPKEEINDYFFKEKSS